MRLKNRRGGADPVCMDDDAHPCAMPAEESYAAAAGVWTCVCERHWRHVGPGRRREIPDRASVRPRPVGV